jgi:SAM-dependent methyltransferase
MASAEQWDAEYRRGRWDYLRGPAEQGRHAVIASYLRHFVAGGRFLDLGAGFGSLYQHLGGCGRYLGLELSAAAVAAAEGVPLVVGDLADYVPDGPLDAVIFNEVLYYCADPAAILQRYRRFLRCGGLLIISMNQPANEGDRWRPVVARCWRAVDALVEAGELRALDETLVVNVPGQLTWRVRALAVP